MPFPPLITLFPVLFPAQISIVKPFHRRMEQKELIDAPGVVEAMEALNLNTHQTTDSSPEDDPSSDSDVPKELSPIEALSLICPIAVLAICASPFQPAPHEMLWRTQIQIAAGSYGRVSVGTLLKRQMNP